MKTNVGLLKIMIFVHERTSVANGQKPDPVPHSESRSVNSTCRMKIRVIQTLLSASVMKE